MNLSWKWKLRLINGFCQGYFFMFTVLTLIVGFNTTLPYLCSDEPHRLFHLKLLALFVFGNMVVNYICIRYTAEYSFFKPVVKKENAIISAAHRYSVFNGRNKTSMNESCHHLDKDGENVSNHSDDIDIGGWTYCKDCTVLVPPRAKHCPLCEACILKRDHHCFFAGCCVGFHNQRYFTMFCFYGAIGGLYSSLVTHLYLCHHYDALQSWGILAYFLPPLLWFWIMGSTTGSIVILTLFLYWNCVTAVMCFYYFGVQVFLIFCGQTKHEALKGIRTYRGNFVLNVKSVFGRHWLVGFLLPGPFFTYEGDGINWDDFMSDKYK